MRISREDLVVIRSKTIKLLPDAKAATIVALTEALIDYPTMVEVETDFRDLKFGVERKIIPSGHGAYGEPESDVYHKINGVSVDVGDTIFLDSEEKPLCIVKVNINKLVTDLKKAYDDSFEIKL